MNRTDIAPLIRREDYAPPAFWIRSVELTFDLDPAKTLVINRMQIERNTALPPQPLRLHGEELNLLRVQANGESVSFRHEDGMLVIDSLQHMPPGLFTLEIRNTCAPDKNTQLSGLYTSNGGFFTQCEAEGFRRITYFLDRPDVMAVYTVTLRASKSACPVLLSNGNLVEQGDLPLGVNGPGGTSCRLSITSMPSSCRNDTLSPLACTRSRFSSSPCRRSGWAGTAVLRSICMRLMTRVLAGSRSNVRSTLRIQNAGGA